MRLFGGVSPADWLVVGLGNPGSRYEGTPHNVGFEVARALIERWGLGEPRKKFDGLIAEGRIHTADPPRPRVAVLMPQTFMNEAGRSVSPARGATRVELDHVLAVHDEIDLPFGDIRPRIGGGLAGHNGLKSLKASLGSPDFARVRIGVGRPDTTDPEIVSSHVLGKWKQANGDVRELIERATDIAERIVLGELEL
jgi:PTH1 family peptidyl-tRNA hydrolase